MATLKYKDKDGQFISLPMIQGSKGDPNVTGGTNFLVGLSYAPSQNNANTITQDGKEVPDKLLVYDIKTSKFVVVDK